MLTRVQRNALFDGIPTKLADMGVPKFRAESGPNEEQNYPFMVVKILTEGNRKEFSFTPMGQNNSYGTGKVGTIYGHIDKATVSVAIDTPDLYMLQDIVEDFYREVWRLELGLNRSNANHVWFRSIEHPIYLPTWYDNKHKKWIHRCVIDIFIEYEVRWERVDYTMLSFSKSIEAVGGSHGNMTVDLIRCASGSYLMDTTIHGPNIKYPVDVILELPSRLKVYSMSTKII